MVSYEHALRNAYLWDPYRRMSENTIAYYDFSDWTDSTWNNHDISSHPWVSITTDWEESVAYVNQGNAAISLPVTMNNIGLWDFTISFWFYGVDKPKNNVCLFGMRENTHPFFWPEIFYDPKGTIWRWDIIYFRTSILWEYPANIPWSALYDSRHHIVMTRKSGVCYCYIDWNLVTSFASSDALVNMGMWFFLSRNDNNQTWTWAGAMGDKLIIEKTSRDAPEVVWYYNYTKSLYGIE